MTAEVAPTLHPLAGVTLFHRVMFGSEASTEMTDDGTGDDVAAGDGVFTATVVTDHSGAWTVENLAEGEYRVELTPERVIHQFAASAIQVQVGSDPSDLMVLAAARVDSPRHNSLIGADVDGSGLVTARDALLVVNDLTQNST